MFIAKLNQITFSKARMRVSTWLPLKISGPIPSKSELGLGGNVAMTEERTYQNLKHTCTHMLANGHSLRGFLRYAL